LILFFIIKPPSRPSDVSPSKGRIKKFPARGGVDCDAVTRRGGYSGVSGFNERLEQWLIQHIFTNIILCLNIFINPPRPLSLRYSETPRPRRGTSIMRERNKKTPMRVFSYCGGGTEIPSTLCVCGETVTILLRYACKIYLFTNWQLRCESSRLDCATQ